MKIGLLHEGIRSLVRVPPVLRVFTAEVLQRKADDHHASHNDWINQALHLLSSSVFIFCYALCFKDLTTAMWLGLPALFARQIGHAIFEPPCHEAEAKLLGFTTPAKTGIVAAYLGIPLAHWLMGPALSWAAFSDAVPAIAWHWFLFTLVVVFGKVAYLFWVHGFWSSMIWFVKLVTDPFSDVVAYRPRFGRA